MKNAAVLIFFYFIQFGVYSQNLNQYEVYAIRFGKHWSRKLSEAAVGAADTGKIEGCNMIWLLKGNGKTILIDAGFLLNENSNRMTNNFFNNSNYIRPDSALLRINIKAEDITDIIITHPHWDHIDGIGLFPSAQLWMQNDDYNYFVGTAWQKNQMKDGFFKDDVKTLVAINTEGRLNLIKGDSIEIFSGIRAFIGSKHTWESQYLLVNTKTDKVIIASDNSWYYYNLEHLLPIPKYTFDAKAYVQQLKRMRTLQPNVDLIIPGHDALVFSKFPKVADDIVKVR